MDGSGEEGKGEREIPVGTFVKVTLYFLLCITEEDEGLAEQLDAIGCFTSHLRAERYRIPVVFISVVSPSSPLPPPV